MLSRLLCRSHLRSIRILATEYRPKSPPPKGLLTPTTWTSNRYLASSTSSGDDSKGKPPTTDKPDDDMFGMDDFVTSSVEDEKQPEDAEADMLQKLSDLEKANAKVENLTPEMASELVSRIVSGTTTTSEKILSSSYKQNILPFISSHTISVLRAARLASNYVYSSASSEDEYKTYPICRRVVGHLDISLLSLSEPAKQALILLAGKQRIHRERKWDSNVPHYEQRQRNDDDDDDDVDNNGNVRIKISCDRFPAREENKAWIVCRMHELVKEAKVAVGDFSEDDDVPLKDWNEVVKEVEKQAHEEIQLVGGSVEKLLGKKQEL